MNRKHLKFITLGALGLVTVMYFSGGFGGLSSIDNETPTPPVPPGTAQGGVGPIDPSF